MASADNDRTRYTVHTKYNLVGYDGIIESFPGETFTVVNRYGTLENLKREATSYAQYVGDPLNRIPAIYLRTLEPEITIDTENKTMLLEFFVEMPTNNNANSVVTGGRAVSRKGARKGHKLHKSRKMTRRKVSRKGARKMRK